MFTIGRIAYRREGVFFRTENALSAGKGWRECTARAKYAIYDCFVFSERELTFAFAICYRPSVCLSSVTFVRPTQAIEIFGNISAALGTLAIH